MPDLKQITPTLSREDLHNGQIAVFTIADISHAAIDAWVEANTQAITTWADDRPFLVLQDFSSVSVLTITPYLGRKATELASLRPGFPGRTAVVVNLPPFFVRVIQGFLGSLARHAEKRERRLFHDRPSAVRWLQEIMVDQPE